MATETLYLSGVVEGPIRLNSPDEKYDSFYVGLGLDAESQKTFDASGMQQQVVKSNETGKPFYFFRRPNKKVIKDELVKFGPPKVLDKDNNAVTDFVGKGSKVTIKVVVYDSRKGKGHRLEAVRVDELVKYEPKPKAEEAAGESAPKKMPF